MKLIPFFSIDAELNFYVRSAAVFVPAYGNDCNVGPDCSQGSLSAVAGDVTDPYSDEHRVLVEIGEDLRVIDPNASSVFDLNFADDAVPTCAERIRNAVCVGPVRHEHAIVDANR